jgi:hypothetical protein
MSDDVLTRIIVFTWLAVTASAVFAWLGVSHWINTRAAERKDRERNALLRHLAGQPAEGARLVLEKMREDEEQARKDAAAQAQFLLAAHQKNMRSATPGARGGLVIMALGVGVSIFFYANVPTNGWTIGLIPVLVGAVVTAFAVFGRRRSGDPGGGGGPDPSAR